MIGKIPTSSGTSVNQIAPNHRVSRWAAASKVATPFDGQPGTAEFGFWFNYFWEEVVRNHRITIVQQQKAAEVLFSIFDDVSTTEERNRDEIKLKLKADFAKRDNSFRENALRQLLLIGFRRISLKDMKTVPRQGGKALAPRPLMAEEVANMQLEAISGKRGESVPIAFRADTRCWEELIQHKGFRTRARSTDSPVHKWYGMDQAWHPFNNPVYRDSMFLRLGDKNADNCLQTVISVGAEFAGITHFPILNDYALVFKARSADGQFLAVKPTDEWTEDDVLKAANDSQKVRVVRDKSKAIDHLEKDNYIYAFHLQNVKLFNTQAFFTKLGHTPFPERAANEIPLSNFLAEIRFVQKWFFEKGSGKIQLYELSFDPIRWLPSESYVEVLIGKQGRNQLETKILSEIKRAQTRTDIGGEKLKYAKFQSEKELLLNGAERQQVRQAIANYYATKPKGPTTRTEKAAAIQALPILKSKIEYVSPVDWVDLRPPKN
jgi:hypothetical protein